MSIFEIFYDYADPRLRKYPLMSTELTPIVIISSYLLFIYKIGPKLMENRKPFQLKAVMVIYNIVQILTNLTLAIRGWPYIITCNLYCTLPITTSDPLHDVVIDLLYVYNFLKMFDFVETVIFVLRKKQNQVSFLHVFHHVGVVSFTWIGSKYVPGGQLSIGAFINGCVHMVMYTYYLASMWFDLSNNILKQSLTFIQIAHQIFGAVLIVIALVNPYCNYPKPFSFAFTIYVFVIIYLFNDFYQKSYSTKKLDSKIKIKK